MTRAVAYLKSQDVPFEIREYEHREKGAVYASQAIAVALEQTAKTLIVQLARLGYVAVLMPGNKSIPFKALAKAYEVKRASMVDGNTAERISGYQIGGISPFAMTKALPVAIDSDLLAYDIVAVNGGRRGVMVLMSPRDIVRVTNARTIALHR